MMRTAFFVQNNMVERATAPVVVFARQNNIELVDLRFIQFLTPWIVALIGLSLTT